MPNQDLIRIGGASGYWGDSDMALPQLLQSGNVDYVAFDYLAEITMSIMARARARDPDKGYATDFVDQVIRHNLADIARTGTRILSNAGGVNPAACAREIEQLVADAGLDLKVAVVTGDDLMPQAESLLDHQEMFSGARFPELDAIASINAYLGAFPIAEALTAGADIVITGRCVDSALTLGACIHAFNWQPGDFDLLAAGSLAGHLIECGPQVTGGNFTDWHHIADSIVEVGYPIAEISADGAMVITKPEGTGGQVTRGTVTEQLVYEIGDPGCYLLPDVTCDFTAVEVDEVAADRVRVTHTRGYAPTDTYKVSATWADGYRIITLWYFIGEHSAEKARVFADAALARTRQKLIAKQLPDFTEVLVDPFGSGQHFGSNAPESASREVELRIAAKHPNPAALTLLLKEASGLALATPPGMALFSGGRPSPSPVVRLFSFLVDKQDVSVSVTTGGNRHTWTLPATDGPRVVTVPDEPALPASGPGESMTVPLRQLAWARSGDKGNHANIGVIARKSAYLPYLWEQLTTEAVEAAFAHFLEGHVDRYFLPGTRAINFLLHDVLGGGGIASLRIDPQGKSYAQILLDHPINLPRQLIED